MTRSPSKRHRRTWPTWTLAVAAFVLALSFPHERPGLAQSVTVPAELQAELLGKLAAHDKSFAIRAGAVAK